MSAPVLQHRNGTLYLDNSQLVANAVAETYITSATVGGSSTTLTVKNIVGFAVNQILLIEELGNENAEIVLTHASTAPSGTTVTLTGALVKTHPVGSRVRVIPYDQVEFSHATTATGSKTVLTVATTANFNPPSGLGSGLVAIDATKVVQVHESSEHSSGYYFARYKNSITSDLSGYTDALLYGGWASNTVGYIIEEALSELRISLSEKLTKNKIYTYFNDCLKIMQGKQVRYPGLYEYNYILGQTSRGVNTVTLPSDAYDTETARSILAIRIGDNKKLSVIDPVEYEQKVGYVKTQVRTEASANDTSLAVDNSYDFADSGSVNVYISGTKYTITYTGVTRDDATGGTAALTGIPASGTGSITVTIPVDTNVWQDEEEGTPTIATVRDGEIEYYALPDASYDNENIYLDYALAATEVNSEGDTIADSMKEAVRFYLKWRVWCFAKNDGVPDMNHPDYQTYRELLNDIIRTSPVEVQTRRVPRINRMNRPSTSFRQSTNTTE